MKVLIMSDSHGLTDEVREIADRHKEEVSAVIHCGDSELALNDEHVRGMQIVRGNCDDDMALPEELAVDVEGYRFLVVHGHLHSIKTTLMNVKYRAEEENAQIICFGHSHIAGAELEDGKLFINPGSIRLPRVRPVKTYAILEAEGTKANVLFYDEKGNPVEELSQSFEWQ
ncbi:metallophosphoesterase [Metabacillus sp. GX 13764]|uniref:metallophosphoesterase family protein n=1 Tax=Metabacillus kandeliae TaxID=2900151 RepID=UPI001E4C4C51|nr:metallophosphoesterase [Metabacillus kandeliae]MCD7032854.1 metallophosphoesterase [Metabacillus kandeliae]